MHDDKKDHPAICKGCNQFYTLTDRRPKILPCKVHSLCFKCLEDQLVVNKGNIQCPQCNSNFNSDIYSWELNQKLIREITLYYRKVDRLEKTAKIVNYLLCFVCVFSMFLQIVYCIAMWVIEGCLTVTYCEFSFFKILINLCAIFKWLKDAFEGEPCHFLSLSPIYTMFFIFELAFIGTKPPDGDEW